MTVKPERMADAPLTTNGPFAILTWRNPKMQFPEPWYVVRTRDRRVMTQGDVVTCCRWVDVWGPMHP